MRTFEKSLNIILAVLAALAGFLLSGCDGAGSSPDQPAGTTSCEMVVTEGSVAASAAGIRIVSVVYNGGLVSSDLRTDAVNKCVGWSAPSLYPNCVASLSKVLSPAEASAECSTHMTQAECSDLANNLVDSAGVKHCWTPFGAGGLDTLRVMTGECQHPICTTKGEYLGCMCS